MDLKEQIRGFWDARPCNIRHSHEPVGTYAYSQQVRNRKFLVEPHIPRFARHWEWCRKNVLDLGCGIGTDALEFARYGARVVAVDMSAASLEILRKRAHSERLGHKIEILHGDIEGLHFSPRSFDLVYSFGVLHHTPHPERALRVAYEAAKPGAKLRIMLYHRYSFKALWILATYGHFQFWKWAELVQRHSEAQTGCPYTRTYTRSEARALVQDAGWKPTQTEVTHIFPYRIADYKEGRLVKEWYWRVMPRVLFSWLERRFGWHLLVWGEK